MRRTANALVLVAVAALACAGGVGCRRAVKADLVIISPHLPYVQQEFEQAFSAWHREKYGRAIKIEWHDQGGSKLDTQYLLKQYERGESSGMDVYFGGGAPDHVLLASQGILLPVELPPETAGQVPEFISGIRQFDAQRRWHGACVSGFGIFYNKELLAANNLPVPRTWDDLGAPGLFGRLAAAEAKSGSAAAAYELIIQSARRQGEGGAETPDWPAGWVKLLRLFGNCKTILGGASEVIQKVSNGEVLASLAIDYYAYVEMENDPQRLGFALVAGSTAFTPDPIALLKGAPHEETARRFIEFVLSERGQALFCLPVGAPGGPVKHALYRQPIRKDVYEKYAGKLLPQLTNPFVQSSPVVYDTDAAALRVGGLLNPLVKAAVVDSADQLRQAWKCIIDAGLPEDLMKELAALPDDLADRTVSFETARKLADPAQREAITSVWQRYFRDKYERIIHTRR